MPNSAILFAHGIRHHGHSRRGHPLAVLGPWAELAQQIMRMDELQTSLLRLCEIVRSQQVFLFGTASYCSAVILALQRLHPEVYARFELDLQRLEADSSRLANSLTLAEIDDLMIKLRT